MDKPKRNLKKPGEGQGKSSAKPSYKPGEGQGKSNAKPSYKASSLEEIEALTEAEVRKATLSGYSKKRVSTLMKEGKGLIEAKRSVIRENFTKHMKGKGKAKASEAGNTQKRARSEDSSPQKRPVKRPRGEQVNKPATYAGRSYKDAASSERVAVVMEGYPEAQLTTERTEEVQAAISYAHESIPDDGPQVRFDKCNHRPGYFEVTCADKTSAEWLISIVPTLKPWEGAVLKAVTGEDLPRPVTCTVFVPDEKGTRMPVERILKKLSVGNKGITTSLWKSWGAIPMDKGQLWTFSMDKQSLEGLVKLDMSPYFGFGRLKFRKKQDRISEDKAHQSSEAPEASSSRAEDKAPAEEERGTDSEGPSTTSGISPLKRPIGCQQKDVAMEEEEDLLKSRSPSPTTE